MNTTKENPRVEQLLIDALGLKSAEECFGVPLELRRRYPQLNDQTTIMLYKDIDSEPIPKQLVIKVGSYPLPTRRKGLKARFWRVVGELLNRPLWSKRGWDQGLAVGRVEQSVAVTNIGWNFSRTVSPKQKESDFGHFATGLAYVAYVPQEDKLYIWTRH